MGSRESMWRMRRRVGWASALSRRRSRRHVRGSRSSRCMNSDNIPSRHNKRRDAPMAKIAEIMELYQMRRQVEDACRAFQSLDRELAKISLRLFLFME